MWHPDFADRPEIIKVGRGKLTLFQWYILEFQHPHPSGYSYAKAGIPHEGKWILYERYWQKHKLGKPVKNKVPRYKKRGVFDTPRQAIEEIRSQPYDPKQWK